MRRPLSLSLRLALLFALVTLGLLGGLGAYLHHALGQQLAWRDDQLLLGRLERMEALLDDGESIAALRRRPLLYANMLGNRDSLLWILDPQGRPLIEINPPGLAVPELPAAPEGRLMAHAGARLAWRSLNHEGRRLTLVAGKRLEERERMLAAYRLRLWLAMGAGTLLASLLGWWVARRGLRPVRRLAARAQSIDARHLHRRLAVHGEVSELRELSRALNQMLSRLEEGFAQLSRFSGDLAHEMRTPLGNLLGATQQTLQREREPAAYRRLLGSHVEEYERLSRMVDTVLLLARTEQPAGALAREPIDLASLVGQLCDYFEGMADDDGRALLNRASGSVMGNLDLLRRALANLIANALQHGWSGTPVIIQSRQTPQGMLLEVTNRGQGIPGVEQERVFERFYRCDAARSRGGATGGLGLAIVRSIARWHGGEASVCCESELTTFRLTLPA
ncbi:heavy metal sensor histidine kinase [Bisbaumannia pacifica]|uniref:Sensor protein n=1 Tax=Bisbaumannia pacifica TaxID=77098 RepID=A0ABD4L6N7_9GAMM|nr:heavy metal sensor histidine kinase [Halomonas pacifica]MBH8581847.1 heavy metal sensor histidine kinase [Halomonas pacifica]